ncbi:MAG: SAM-dependent methyltransferase [Pirellula sp.]|nr:SAM-dependent methyltransferase [Pirellula sp.]
MMRFLIALSAGSRGRLAASALLASSWLVQSSTTALAQNAPPEARDRQESAIDDAAVAPAARERTEYMGRTIAPTMHFSGAGWLTRPTREQEEEPLKLLNSLKIQPGQIVCDFGSGNGYHSLQLAKRVGPTGAVHAIDIQPEMLEMLRERAGPRGLANIKPVLATAEESGLAPDTFDLVLMVDVYHELSNPAEILAAVHKSLKSEGRLVLVEFREEDESVPILPLHKMSQLQVVKELEANDFKLIGQFDRLPWQHVLQFARHDAELPKVALRPWRP